MEEKNKKTLLVIVGIFCTAGIAGIAWLLLSGRPLTGPLAPTLGSVTQASEYHSTTTFSGMALETYLTTTTGNIYQTYQGTLGSVIITKAGTGQIDIYDATTTVASRRAASMATNTIRLASFPASVAAGTYTFDTVFHNGLLVVISTDNIPTSTITWR